jgi:hypothetical protein
MMRKLVLALIALLVIAVAAPATNAQTMNMVRVMHASPDAPAVDVYVNGQSVLTNVPFFAVSNYLSLPDGSYAVAVTPAGKPESDAVLRTTLTVRGGYTGTVAAVGFVQNIEATLFEDNLSPVPAGKARVRIIHASPNAPAVDIKLAGTNTVVVANAPFKAAATVEVDAGTYRFDISPAGQAAVVFTTPALRFESGWVYTLVATGDLNKNFWVQSRVDKVGP